MKKILLSVIYPFWFFFGVTWIGVLMIPISLSPIPILIILTFPDIMTGEGTQGVGNGIGILSLLCSPFIGMGFMIISDKLKSNYKKWNYKTEMESKMV